ncbi:MAG: DUF5689 domain-containing protein [Bacteroidota bacterium]
MKSTIKQMAGAAIVAALLLFSSCYKEDFDVPPVVVPEVDFPSNTTIADLKASYSGNLDSIGTDKIIEGIVVANDESGNLYKTLVIQDATAGIELKIDQTDLYTEFRVGQRVFVKCAGLYLGNYGGLVQIGYIYNGAIGRIPSVMIATHIFKDSLPGNPPVPTTLTIPGFSTASLSKLVRIDSVYFPEAGQPFVNPLETATSRTITDVHGNTLILRTSSYSNFSTTLLPQGIGSLVGELTVYNGDYQLVIRDMNDVVGFSGSAPSLIIDETFSTAGSLGTFNQFSITGAEIWTQGTFGSDNYAKMSGYAGGSYYANEDWLISPSVDLDSYNSETLSFFTMMNYGVAGDGSFKVYYSQNYVSGDPTTAGVVWTEMTGLTLSTGAWALVNSGDIDITAITGNNVHFAFKYTCGTTNVSTWELGGIQLKATHN